MLEVVGGNNERDQFAIEGHLADQILRFVQHNARDDSAALRNCQKCDSELPRLDDAPTDDLDNRPSARTRSEAKFCDKRARLAFGELNKGQSNANGIGTMGERTQVVENLDTGPFPREV